MKERIQKLIAARGVASRRAAEQMILDGRVTCNGMLCTLGQTADPVLDEILIDGEPLPVAQDRIYIMLNKPEGYISATDDMRERCVLELLGERERRLGLFPCGRLDKNTLGLLILTNDGELCHRLLSPKYHVSKVYYFKAERIVTDEDHKRLENGVTIDGELTKPAKLTLRDDRMSGYLTITEGKFHQVKRMLEAVCNKVVYLERVEFAGIPLDTTLERGRWRELTADEEAHLRSFLA